MTPSIGLRAAAAVGVGCLALAGCGAQVYSPAAPSAPSATASPAQSLAQLESERALVAGRYWPATAVVMKAVPEMEKRLGIQLKFEEATGTYATCDTAAGTGLQYRVAVILEASAGPDVDLGGPLGEAAKIAEQKLTATGWGTFAVSQGVWVAGTEHGVTASFDNDPAATETDTSFATALVYFLEGECVLVPGTSDSPPGGGSQAGGGPDAGPPPGAASAGDGLPPVRDTYGLGPAALPPLGQAG